MHQSLRIVCYQRRVVSLHLPFKLFFIYILTVQDDTREPQKKNDVQAVNKHVLIQCQELFPLNL